jgi:hypothetical protein
MEKQDKLLRYVLLVLVLGISLVSAQMTAPESVNLNENFQLKVSINGFYALELNLPENFQIISDDSGGIRTDLYRTFTSGDLLLTLRPSQSGIYTILGQYTTGEGIKDLDSITIQVQESSVSRSCPTCPTESNWSNCEDGKQIKITYKCSFLTNYHCQQKTESRSCEIPQESPICLVGWVCKDNQTLAYQTSDCSFSSMQNCEKGCENNECNVLDVPDETTIPDLNINISDEPVQRQDPEPTIEKKGFFRKILDFFKMIWDKIIFWR